MKPDERMRVLLIDDDEGDRLIMRRALEKAQQDVHVEDLAAAPPDLAQLARGRYDVILLDHILPGSDAFRFLARAKEVGLRTPVVVVTGYEEEILDIELMEAGATAYLSKDRLTSRSLWRTLSYAVRISRAEQKRQALTAGLRAVVQIADELIRCETVDAICRRAVELAREKLGVERCSIFMRDGDVMRGTYGTDLQGRTTDEHACVLPDWPAWESRFAPVRNGDPRWVLCDKPLAHWDGRQLLWAGSGWNACTPISQARRPPTAVFFNDAALSGAPFDPVRQEVVSVLCSALGDLLERKKTECALRESEASFKALAENAMDGILILGANGLHAYANARAAEITGYRVEELTRMGIADLAHPAERERLLARARARFGGDVTPSRYETVIVTKDGRHLPIEVSATGTIWQGQPAAMAIIRDIADRKQVEEERRSLAARLMEVQEQERKEISAVLHDHLGQLLTLARLELSAGSQKNGAVAACCESAARRIDEALAAVRDMAVALRPPLLDDLGLEAALESLAEDFARRSNLKIRVKCQKDLPALDAAVQTCLYRVVQEALTNVAKHAKAHRVTVTLGVEQAHVVLEVADDGIGLAERAGSSQKGIGLIGLRERLGRLGGSLEVTEAVPKGTRVLARVPAAARTQAEERHEQAGDRG